MSKQPNRHHKDRWYTNDEVLDLLQRFSDTCIAQKIYLSRFIKKSSDGVEEVAALEDYRRRRKGGGCTIKQTLKRIIREEFTDMVYKKVMQILYETHSDDLLLLVNDENPLVQDVVKWRYSIGK